MKAFYFATKDRKLRYNDNSDIVVGETHEVSGKIELCDNGLHASRRLIDAIQYAPGPILYLVELSGKIVEGEDKCAASKRKYLAEFDASEVLMKFARKQALINIELIKPYYLENDYNLIVKYLETGDEELRAAAANATASVYIATLDRPAWAAKAAAWAAKAAAWAAARAWTARSTAEAASWAVEAAKSTAEAANYNKSIDEANIMLTNMIREATGWDI